MRGKLRTLSGLRQRIVSLREERKRLEDSLFRPKKMIRASLSFIPVTVAKRTVAAGEVNLMVLILIYLRDTREEPE